MNIQNGDMWSVFDQSDLFLITTNSTVRKDGHLVMGKGIALEANTRFPGISLIAGQWIEKNELEEQFYGVIRGIFPDQPNLGLFQTKTLFGLPSNRTLLEMSCNALADVLTNHYYENVNLNFPAVGFGRMKEMDVLPILKKSLDRFPNLTIWTNTLYTSSRLA